MTTRSSRVPRTLATLATLALAGALPLSAQTPSTGPVWQIVPQPQSSLVYARDGSLIGEIGTQWRTNVAVRTLPRYVAQAFVAVEDKRFYQHDGVDLLGVASAVKDAILGDSRGASTITQQLVGNLHPDLIDRRDRSPARKLREQSAAREMERHYSKEQILEAYLNVVNFGNGWYGVEAAARHYFGKPAARLTLVEAATLAALPKSPVYYDPRKYADRSRERRNLVLDLMAEQGYVTAAQAAQAKAQPIVVAPNAGMSIHAPYFVDAVKSFAAGRNIPLAQGGFRVFTTLDPVLQRAAQVALVEGAAKVETRPGYRHAKYGTPGATDVLQGMVAAMDPATGDVRALVGGRNYAAGPFNRATQGIRQPGSSFKPFVYARAIEDSIPASAIVPDTALAIPMFDGSFYRPGNSDGKFAGAMTVREALVQSRNTVAIQLGLASGMDSVSALAKRVGLDTPVPPYPSSAIGAAAVRPLDLLASYTVFANLGTVVEPRFVTRIEDAAGRVLYSVGPSPQRPVMDPRVAYLVRDLMRESVERGTGAAARRAVPRHVPVAGKTGTTNDNVDVWFVGMTGDIVAAVWLGFDRPKTIAGGVAGGTLAAPIWGQMMAQYYAGRAAAPFKLTPLAGLSFFELDRATGALADSLTPPERRYLEAFIEGTEPEPLRSIPWKVPRFGGW